MDPTNGSLGLVMRLIPRLILRLHLALMALGEEAEHDV